MVLLPTQQDYIQTNKGIIIIRAYVLPLGLIYLQTESFYLSLHDSSSYRSLCQIIVLLQSLFVDF